MATVMRRKRFSLFLGLLERLPRPVTILDVGGTPNFWERMKFVGQETDSAVHVTLLNLHYNQPIDHPNFTAMIGDATNMSNIANATFDMVFSNSVIEHVGDFSQQQKMADEVQRVGKHYFLQTPNYYFPIEPHVLFPGFQWLPTRLRVFLLTHFKLGWVKRMADAQQAQQWVDSTILLRKRDLQKLFPQAQLYEEKLFGLTKSFIVYDRW